MKKKIMLTSAIIAIVVITIVLTTIVVSSVMQKKEEEEIVKSNDEIISQVELDKSNSITDEIIDPNINNEEQENEINDNFVKDEEMQYKENIDNNQKEENAVEENAIEETEPEVEYIQGMEVAGHMKISKFNVDAPIFRYVNKDTIDISMAVAYGNLNQVGNTTIFGVAYNNYPFEKISQLENGDTIVITDSNKNEITYEVYDKQIVDSTDATYMIRNTNGVREITLQTTGDSATTRLIVVAREI